MRALIDLCKCSRALSIIIVLLISELKRKTCSVTWFGKEDTSNVVCLEQEEPGEAYLSPSNFLVTST